MDYGPTPLRKELVEWCGYHYRKEHNIWWRDRGHVLLREYEEGFWAAHLIWQDPLNAPFLCHIESLGRLILLCLAIDGDAYPIEFKIPKKELHGS
jgi:hypothetical protein